MSSLEYCCHFIIIIPVPIFSVLSVRFYCHGGGQRSRIEGSCELAGLRRYLPASALIQYEVCTLHNIVAVNLLLSCDPVVRYPVRFVAYRLAVLRGSPMSGDTTGIIGKLVLRAATDRDPSSCLGLGLKMFNVAACGLSRDLEVYVIWVYEGGMSFRVVIAPGHGMHRVPHGSECLCS